jgi:aspartyl-tRNA(Asn)/glutamyl-tRNA(Gln) amidotransferase subunit A
MTDILFQDMATVAELVRTKAVSPVELTKRALNRIEKLDSQTNAFIRVMSEEALHQAKILESEAAAGEVRGPLHGIPIAIKDIFETKGHVTTAGSKVFEHWIPDKDATVVSMLKQAGAVIVGKTNMHEFAMGATNENPHYGATRNPWNVQKIPGGSSGGSAAAVASGMCFGALGTDTAGSVRLPAAFCGLVGLKPTYGVVSRYGCVPFSWSLDHIGPMTRNVKDSIVMMQSLGGYDPKDQASSRRSIDFAFELPLQDLRGKVVGVCREYFFDHLDNEVRIWMDKSISLLESLGAEVREISIAGIEKALQSFKLIAQSEVLTFHGPIFKRHAEMYGEDIRFRFNFAQTISAVEYLNAQKYRSVFIERLLHVMKSIDVLVAPTNSLPPYTIGSIPPEETMNNIFNLGKTPFANFVGFPALSVPCGILTGNLPTGIQFIGKPFSDKQLLRIGECFEHAITWMPTDREKSLFQN